MTGVTSAPRARTHQHREIEREVRSLLGSRSARASVYGEPFAQLWSLASRCILGGKLLRPALLMEAFDALRPGNGGELRDSALRIAAGIELLHVAFLLHDDVIDGDLLRRGSPNLIGALLQERDSGALGALDRPRDGKSLHWARSNGILIGDLMLAAAHQVFARETVAPEMRLRLLDLLDHAITESVAGEQWDVGLSDGVLPSDVSAVLETSRLKTATYSFELPLRAAAVLAGVGEPVEDALAAVGRQLGVAFQLQDDLLSAFGRSEEHGKDPFSDLREGKETVIVAYARMTSAWASIEPRFGAHDLSRDEGMLIRSLLSRCGAEDFVRSLIDERIRAALDVASSEEHVVPPAMTDVIVRLVDTLEGRRS